MGMESIDTVFKAYDVRGLYESQITEEMAWAIGFASAKFLRSQIQGMDSSKSELNRIVVGRDMRPHSPGLTRALIEGITASGVNCVDIGMVDTPQIYFAINHLGACGGIQVTASHNAIEYNGFKVSGFKASPVGETTGLMEIRDLAKQAVRTPADTNAGTVQEINLWDEYRAHVLQFLDLPRKLKVVVDASNGMAGKMIPEVFGAVEELEIIPIFFEIGEGFVHPPNPLVAANLKWVQDGVKEHGADLGICLDGDADRCMFVDEKGEIIRCDLMTALLAIEFLKTNEGSTIVYDLRSSKVLAEVVRDAGGIPRRERVGHAFLKKAMAETHAVFGGELSGHSYFRDNFHADSAAIVFAVAASLLARSDQPISAMVEPLKKYSHSGEINFEVADKTASMKQIEELFVGGEVDYLDGVSITFPDWWINVRPSNTEPLLRLSMEANTPEMLAEKLALVKPILGEPVDH
jgi:phosphomannomutase